MKEEVDNSECNSGCWTWPPGERPQAVIKRVFRAGKSIVYYC